MNADELVSRARDWLNSTPHSPPDLRSFASFAAKILFSLITQPQPNAPDKAQALRIRTQRQNPARPRRRNHPVQIL
jgi:hypothetical protein